MRLNENSFSLVKLWLQLSRPSELSWAVFCLRQRGLRHQAPTIKRKSLPKLLSASLWNLSRSPGLVADLQWQLRQQLLKTE